MALWAMDLPPIWLPQIPSCNSSRSNSDASGWMQSRYGPEKKRLYSFWSSDSQNRGAFLRTFSVSDLSFGKMSIQLGPILTCWMQIIFSLIPGGLHKSSIRITRGKFCAEKVDSVARESAWVSPLLGMCYRLNDSNFSCRCLIWVKYPCILSSLASNLPFTWPMTSLESKNCSRLSPHSLNHRHSFQ